MMYISYVSRWWQDAVNFNAKQTRAFDELDSTTKVRFYLRVPSVVVVDSSSNPCN